MMPRQLPHLLLCAALLTIPVGCAIEAPAAQAPTTPLGSPTPSPSSPASPGPSPSPNIHQGDVTLLESYGTVTACLGEQESNPPRCVGIEIDGAIDWSRLDATGSTGELPWRRARAHVAGNLRGTTLSLTAPVTRPTSDDEVLVPPERWPHPASRDALIKASDAADDAIMAYFRERGVDSSRLRLVSIETDSNDEGYLTIQLLAGDDELRRAIVAAATQHVPEAALAISMDLTKV